MAWNPDIYNKFKTERFQPFYDCLGIINPKPGMKVIDLGCGTGELTLKLATHLPHPLQVVGIDSSGEMLGASHNFQHPKLHFDVRSIEEEVVSGHKWDLVFSNAAIQWVENHPVLLPRIISTLEAGGQLVIQLPAQHQNITNLILAELAATTQFRVSLDQSIKPSPVLKMEEYARILFDHGGVNITVLEKIYPVVVKDFNGLYDWVSGTALLPYLEPLKGDDRQDFIMMFKQRLQHQFPGSPVFYPFKRIIMAATFP